MAEPGAGFDSRGLGLRAQKKLLGKMSSKKIAMTFIDETTGRVLDNAHKVLKQYKGHKKEADKVLKYIIKSVVKVGILYKNDQFNREELTNVELFKQKFHSLAMTLVSFHQVDFTYDKAFLRKSLEECKQLLQTIIARHLTDKSKTRVDIVFNTFSEPEFLDAVFTNQSFKSIMEAIVADLNTLMDEGNL
ncbi:tumor necrosis factor alpha-induced protein 8-like [Physella acuta]|uniref:tumor necrosis factor alpha-induced protein 8-like n=1 Tax=Physella acuta TaxID=109671 RepID=UPI0027DC6D5B|nr:tumor necrosis factor alpha-induced protein 8-like [Physella acuta]XP_059171687.1 tumor necrosis factor alpha-induced protein 8-like [Physella acuta]XP_059171688.1 tumor necrosis factor alpha-induced protein 8-like [Physella acuta]XP_059171689.1 tumor necrosis factor alpha-induced protein 8-like [Physella acuta]XP_059171690.1 tumor necrosis factor alpha-induced protein 8-like [Physella acuta]XP_059171691.1 tumor necrosis factor alpha-induced protein 8-like [Physella acuta]